MGIKVRVKLNIKKKFSNEALHKGKLLAANEAHQAMEQFVPMLHTDSSTNLRSLSMVTPDGKIKYSAVYARTQFYGLINGKYPVKHYTTPGTSKRWDLRLKGDRLKMKDVMNAFIKGTEWDK